MVLGPSILLNSRKDENFSARTFHEAGYLIISDFSYASYKAFSSSKTEIIVNSLKVIYWKVDL